jgi:hypothetical protein
MAVLRFLASLFLLVAVVALVSDVSPWLSGAKPFSATSLAKHWGDLTPGTLQAAKTAVSRTAGSWLWDYVILSIIRIPTSVLFGALGLALGWFGRRRRRVDIYSN